MSEFISKIKRKATKTLSDWSKTRLTTPTVVIRILRPIIKDTQKNFFLNRKEVKTFTEEDWLADNSIQYEVIYGSESEITEGGTSLNSVHRLYSSTIPSVSNIIENKRKLKEGIIGIQIEEASVYGSFIQLSVADFTNDVLNNVRSNDLIFAWVFDLDDLIKKYGDSELAFTSLISSSEFADIIDNTIFPTAESEGLTPHFSGFVTAVHKHIKDKSRTNIEGLDLNKYLQHYSIPKAIGNNEIDRIQLGADSKDLIDKGNVFSAVNSFFANSILEALKKDFIKLDIGNDVETLRFERFIIRPIDKINIEDIEDKVYITFLKGCVTILTIHPLVLLKCVYKYFFHLIGLGNYLYPDVDYKEIKDYVKHIDINNKNLISVGIIYQPYSDNTYISDEFNKYLNDEVMLKQLLTNQKMLFSFNLSGEEDVYISEATKHVTKNQALFTTEGQIRLDVGEPVTTERIFGFDVINLITEPTNSIELINFVRYNIFRTFKDTMDIDSLLHKNSYTMRSQKFLPVNQYVSTTLNKLRDGVPLLFLIKTLFYASTGVLEPVYTWTEIDGSKNPPKVLNSIRNTMWIKIDFKLIRKNNKIFVKSVLKNNFVSHRTEFTKEIIIKEEDILEYQSSTIKYPLSIINIKTTDGYITIADTTYAGTDENNYMMFHPSSILALNLGDIVSNKLPLFPNTYTRTATSFCPSIYKAGMTDTSTVLYNKTGPPNNVLTIYHQDQEHLQKNWDTATCKLIRYKNIGNYSDIGDSNGVGYIARGEEAGTVNSEFVFGDEKHGTIDNFNLNVGVTEYINPTNILNEIERIKDMIVKTEVPRGSASHGFGGIDMDETPAYSSYGVFDYRQYKNISIHILYDKNINPHAQFIYEEILGLTNSNQTIGFKTFLNKVDNYFSTYASMTDESFWARKLPTRLWVYENRTRRQSEGINFIRQDLYKEIQYDFDSDYYVDGEKDKDLPMYINNSEVSKYVYALKVIIGIYTSVSRYYDELLATQAVKSSVYIPASIDINVGDKLFIMDDKEKLNLDSVGTKILPIVGATQTSIGIAKEGIAYLPDNVRSTRMRENPLFCWKRVIYIGDAGGTSGFTRKVYLTNNPFNWVINFEEKDLTTRLAANIQNKLGLYEVLK